jgi:putative transposase
LLGDIINHEMVLNDAGRMVMTVWSELPQRFSNIELIEYVIMPNHIHGIIALVVVPLVGTLKTVSDHQSGQTQGLPLQGD